MILTTCTCKALYIFYNILYFKVLDQTVEISSDVNNLYVCKAELKQNKRKHLDSKQEYFLFIFNHKMYTFGKINI